MGKNSNRISRSGKKTRNLISFTEYKNLNEKEFCQKAEEIKNFISDLEKQVKALNSSGTEELTKREKSEKALREIEWMLHDRDEKEAEYVPEYGDLSSMNKEGMILNLLGKKQLKDIVADYLHLLETSAAIYEKNGDYALGVFSSGWCRMMDAASRKLCNTSDNREAMNSGKWLCHESCWKDASLPSIKEGKAVDVKCNGGINLYAMPIRTNGEITGSINFGYGNPPTDDQSLKDLSAKYKIPVKKLREKAESYPARPRFITDLAKKRLSRSALLMESLIESKLAQEALAGSNEQIRITLNSIGDAVISTDTKGRIVEMNPVAEKLTGWSLNQAKDMPFSKVFNIVNAVTGKKAEDPVDKVLKTGHVVGLANHTKLISRKRKEYQIADSGAPIKDSDNTIKGVVIVFRDVTEEYELQENLKESEQTLNKAQEIGKMGSWKFDLSAGKVSASAEAMKIYGFDAGEDLTIEKVQKIPLPEFRNKLDEALYNLVK
ncbi:MAG: PAS domain S-box protein, partial [bacterium]